MSLPSYYKYELGGQSSLRGSSNSQQFDNSGGKLIYDLVNIEQRFSIINRWGGVIFIDAGRLFNNISGYFNVRINWDYGVGISYMSTLGPIRVEYAFPATSNIRTANMDGLHAALLYMF